MMDFEKMKNLISVADWPYIWPSSFEYYMTKINYVSVGDKNSTSLIGDRESLPSTSPSYWMPSINRLMTAHKFGISFKQAFYREVWIKILRFCYRMLNLVRGRYWFNSNVAKLSGCAEDEGFEPSVGCPTHAFQACALGRYANPPLLLTRLKGIGGDD